MLLVPLTPIFCLARLAIEVMCEAPPGLRACPRGTRHLRSVLPAACDYERFAAMLAMRKQKTEFSL
jgi:hypothetical protein